MEGGLCQVERALCTLVVLTMGQAVGRAIEEEVGQILFQ
jgi:hypothetical protein